MLDLRKVFTTKNNILNKLLGTYVGLRFIGVNQDAKNKLEYMTDVLNTGWHYYPDRDPDTGQVTETLKVVESSGDLGNICRTASMCELYDGNGGFLRFTIKARRPPIPPGFEWVMDIQPNPLDKRPIT